MANTAILRLRKLGLIERQGLFRRSLDTGQIYPGEANLLTRKGADKLRELYAERGIEAEVRWSPTWREFSDTMMTHHLGVVSVLMKLQRLVWDLSGTVIQVWDDGHFRGAVRLEGGLMPDALMIVEIPTASGESRFTPVFVELDLGTERQTSSKSDKDITTKINRYASYLRDSWQAAPYVLDIGCDPAQMASPIVLFVVRGTKRRDNMIDVATRLECRHSYWFTSWEQLFLPEPALASGADYYADLERWWSLDHAALSTPVWDTVPRKGRSLRASLLGLRED